MHRRLCAWVLAVLLPCPRTTFLAGILKRHGSWRSSLTSGAQGRRCTSRGGTCDFGRDTSQVIADSIPDQLAGPWTEILRVGCPGTLYWEFMSRLSRSRSTF